MDFVVLHLSKKKFLHFFFHTIQIRVRQTICHQTLPLVVLPKLVKDIVIMPPMFLGGTQSSVASLKSLCHSPKVIGQFKKWWLINSPLPIYIEQRVGLSALYGLATCSKSLILTYIHRKKGNQFAILEEVITILKLSNLKSLNYTQRESFFV